METRRWTNPSQPQTLYIATFLLYFDAVFTLLFSGFNPIALALVAGSVAGGFGIANEHRWGYLVALVVATIGLLFFVVLPLVGHLGLIFSPVVLLNAVFPVALFALLVHPRAASTRRSGSTDTSGLGARDAPASGPTGAQSARRSTAGAEPGHDRTMTTTVQGIAGLKELVGQHLGYSD